MKLFKITGVLALSLVMLVTGTSCNLFGGSSRLTPENIYEELNKGDSEPCEDMDEILGDIDNERAMLAGMFASFEGKDIKKTLKSEELNTYYADVGEEVFADLYTKNISRMTLYVQGEELEDTNGNIKLALCSMQFESDDEAWKYYKSLNTNYAELIDATENESDLNYEQDGKLEGTMTTINKGRNLVTYDVYIEGNCVMVLIGYARRTNELTDRLNSLCESLTVPSTDVSKWDLMSSIDAENRLMMAIEQLRAEEITEIEDDELPDIADYSGSPYYFVTDKPGVIEDIGMGKLKGAQEVTVLYNFSKISTTRISNMSGSIGYALKCEDADKAEEIYNKVKRLHTPDTSARSNTEENGEVDGIKYYTITDELSSRTVYYGFYQEENMVYVVCAYDKNSSSTGSNNFKELCNMMQLP